MSKPRGIPSMTGIRGIAAVWVMLFHAQQDAGKIFGFRLIREFQTLCMVAWELICSLCFPASFLCLPMNAIFTCFGKIAFSVLLGCASCAFTH